VITSTIPDQSRDNSTHFTAGNRVTERRKFCSIKTKWATSTAHSVRMKFRLTILSWRTHSTWTDPSTTTFVLSTNTDFKNLKTGEIINTIEKTGGSIEWFNDNATVIYNTLDATHRSDKVHKYSINSGKSELVISEADEKFNVGPGKTMDNAYMLISIESTLTSEFRYIDANGGDLKMVVPRELGHEYDVEHLNGNFLITSNADGCINFKLVSAPVSNPAKENWVDIVPYDEKTQILSAIPLTDNSVAVYECSVKGFKQIRILNFAGEKAVGKLQVVGSKLVEFPEQVYEVSPSGSSQQVFNSGVLRMSYSSMTTPPQVWEYSLATSSKTCLKQQEFEGFVSDKYVVERVYAQNGDTSIPISLVYRKDLKKKDMPLYLYGYGSYGIS
jgi:oligopeptidase B